jgi:ribosomal protein S18 acetylase RimI-like enzyme
MYDNDKKIGYSIIKVSNDIFNKWNKNSIGDIENKVDDSDLMVLYIIGISITNKKLGYGGKMIRFIEEFAKENGFDYIALSSTTEAFGFWRKIGYKIYSSDEFIKMYKKI